MGKRRDLQDDEVIRFLRFSVPESAAATFTEQAYDTQLSIDRGFIWMIHWVETSLQPTNVDEPAAGASESISVQITRESKNAILAMSDPDLIAKVGVIHNRSATIGTDAGPMWVYDKYPVQTVFNPPLIYAAMNIYIGIKSSSGAAQTGAGRIAYTLRRVSDKFFYRVAQALIS